MCIFTQASYFCDDLHDIISPKINFSRLTTEQSIYNVTVILRKRKSIMMRQCCVSLIKITICSSLCKVGRFFFRSTLHVNFRNLFCPELNSPFFKSYLWKLNPSCQSITCSALILFMRNLVPSVKQLLIMSS